MESVSADLFRTNSRTTEIWHFALAILLRMMYSEILDFHNVEGAEDQAQEGLGAVQDAQAQAQQATMAQMQQAQA